MWTYSELKDTRDPYLFGTLIKQKVKCGKTNCICHTKGEKHEAYYLKWRDKDVFSGISKIRKKYIKKADVENVKAKLEYRKGLYILPRLNISQVDFILSKAPPNCGKEIYPVLAYRYFGKLPYPEVEENPLVKEIREPSPSSIRLKQWMRKERRKEYLRQWRWNKKRERMGL